MRSNKLDFIRKKLIYETVIKPVITNGINIWNDTSRTNMKHIEIIQNESLKIMENAHRYVKNKTIHQDLGVPTIPQRATDFEKKNN